MSERRIRRFGALLLVGAALGLFAAVTWRRATDDVHRAKSGVPSRESSGGAPAPSPNALILESYGGSRGAALRPASPPRARATATDSSVKPLPIAKSPAAIMDSAAAHQTQKPEERGPGKKHSAIQLRRDNLLKEKDGEYGFSNGTYGATLGKGRVEIARAAELSVS